MSAPHPAVNICRRRFQRLASLLALALVALPSVARADEHADEIVRWNRVATDVTAAAQMDPLTESRILAILHLAMHDAVNTVEPRFERYSRKPQSAPGASAEAGAAAAAQTVLIALLPKEVDTFNRTLTESLADVPNGESLRKGLDAGRRAARRILKLRAADGADMKVEWKAGRKPGEYRETPPENLPGLFNHWGRITPFALESSSQFRPVPPPTLDSAAYAADVAEVRTIGSASSTTRTAEGTEIARFWYENSTLGWNRIARNVVAGRSFDLWEQARLFALLNVAMADGFIAGFEAKYHYHFWRPVTAIREAAADGNDATQPDAGWMSALSTPPVPDYPSTHTVLGAAAAAVLARVLENDFVAFEMTSGAPYAGITRRFTSFSQAARENGQSRVLAGIHFGSAVRAGYRQGEDVGLYVVDTILRPIDDRAPAMTRR